MTRTCLYTVLGVDRKADGAALKAAYRRLALQLHPDKNSAEDRESAEEKFKEAKEAFDILSDPHQRAWYDEHRAEFLRGREVGDSGQGGAEGPSGSVRDLTPFFQAKCYEGFGSGPRSFFAVYSAVFKALADDEDGSDDDDDGGYRHQRAPPFGDAATAYRAGVKDFYDYFSAFSSSRSFSWADKYNTAAAENRQIRRLMERENERERERERRKFSDAVRKLCSHVKELDPRVLAHLAQVAAEQQQRRAEAERAKRAAEAERAAKLKAYKEAEWSRLQQGDDPDDGDGSDGEDEEVVELYCPACRKSFRSDKQFESHEQSKKHKDAVAKLRRELLAEEGIVEGDEGEGEGEEEEVGEEAEGGAAGEAQDGEEEDKKKPSSSAAKKPSKPVQEGQKRPLTKKEKKELAEAKARQARGETEDPADDKAKPAEKPAKGKEKEKEKRPAQPPQPAQPQPAQPQPSRPKKKPAGSDQDSDGAFAPEPGEHECLVCGQCFPSRTKLFAHIEAKGHAQLKDVLLDRKDTARGGSRGKKNK